MVAVITGNGLGIGNSSQKNALAKSLIGSMTR